jgi:threonyl-tRNA synthetase
MGCYERTLAWLIEKYAGALPTWLMPEQVRILPISDKYLGYAETVRKALRKADVKVEVDKRAEKIGYKIREARLEKIPYMLIVGANEEEEGTVSVRRRGEDGDLGAMPLDKFIADITEEIREKRHD